MVDLRERLTDMFLQELHDAVSARIEAGADPDELSAELQRRLRRLRSMQHEARSDATHLKSVGRVVGGQEVGAPVVGQRTPD